jgi:pilus assembly protein TadC
MVPPAVVAALAVLAGLGACLCSAGHNISARRLARSRAGRPASPGRPNPRRRRARTGVADVPPALDLLAACLSAGAMLESALSAAATAFDAPVGPLLAGIARLSALGAPPEDAWSQALRDPVWAPVARAVIRAQHSGAALTEVLNRAASDLRRELRSQAESSAARASVHAVLPLGLCFLPAFLLLGVVPVVAGFTASLT